MNALTRRAFFQSSAERLALLAIASRATACKQYEGDGNRRVLSNKHVAVLLALAEVLVPATERLPVKVQDTDIVLRIDQFLAHGEALATRQFVHVLTAIEHYPQLFSTHFTRFSRLSLADREAVIHDFAESRFFVKRAFFTALKSVICNHYFSDVQVQSVLGYAPACRW